MAEVGSCEDRVEVVGYPKDGRGWLVRGLKGGNTGVPVVTLEKVSSDPGE